MLLVRGGGGDCSQEGGGDCCGVLQYQPHHWPVGIGATGPNGRDVRRTEGVRGDETSQQTGQVTEVSLREACLPPSGQSAPLQYNPNPSCHPLLIFSRLFPSLDSSHHPLFFHSHVLHPTLYLCPILPQPTLSCLSLTLLSLSSVFL